MKEPVRSLLGACDTLDHGFCSWRNHIKRELKLADNTSTKSEEELI